MRRHHLLIAAAAALLVGASPALRGQQPPPYQFRYHPYAESTALLKGLEATYPKLARVYSIGKSATGARDLWCIEIGNQALGKADEKPAVFFDGNQHAGEVMGGEVTLHLAHYLLANYGRDQAVTRLVDTRVTYIVQRSDPDGAEAFMTSKVDWDVSKVPGAKDLDGDGRMGEDGPDDVDGDGDILRMRVLDPNGDWKPYVGDKRLMVKREKGDTLEKEGPFYRVMDEGIDNDGDGRVNEDAPITSFISNRNYPAYWISDDGRFRGEGDYPLQEHNARLLTDFILAHPRISEIESFHTTSGIHLRPYAARPDSEFPPQDLQDYSAILAKGTEITGYPVASVYNDFTTIVPGVPADHQPGIRHGVFIDWGYVHRGLFSLTTELWTMEPFINEIGGWGNIPRDKWLFAIPNNYLRPDVQAAVLKWLDAHKGDARLGGQGFVDWKPFRHPTLGEVELGGFTKYWLRNPPPGPYFEKVAVDQAKFAVVQALTTPLVKITNVTVKPAGPAATGGAGMWTVAAEVMNEGYLDTSMQQARLVRISKPVLVAIGLPASASTTDPKVVAFDFLRGLRGSTFESRYTATWRVSAPVGASITVTLSSEKGGTDRKTVVAGK